MDRRRRRTLTKRRERLRSAKATVQLRLWRSVELPSASWKESSGKRVKPSSPQLELFLFCVYLKTFRKIEENNISVSLCVCVAWLALVCFLLNLLYWFEKSAVTPEAKNPIKMRVLKFRAVDSHPVWWRRLQIECDWEKSLFFRPTKLSFLDNWMVPYRTLSPYTFSMICVDNRIIEAFCGCSAQSLSEFFLLLFFWPRKKLKQKQKQKKNLLKDNILIGLWEHLYIFTVLLWVQSVRAFCY